MSLNIVSLVGVVAKKPTRTYTRKGTDSCVVTVGVDRPWAPDKTDWIRCQAYGKTAGWLCDWMDKGKRVGITGSLCCDAWTDKDGNKQHMWYVLVDRAEFVERKQRTAWTTPVPETAYQGPDGVEYEDLTGEEVPF